MMIPSGVKIHLALGHTDMRKSFDGLSILVQEVLQKDPFSGHLFALSEDRVKMGLGDTKIPALDEVTDAPAGHFGPGGDIGRGAAGGRDRVRRGSFREGPERSQHCRRPQG